MLGGVAGEAGVSATTAREKTSMTAAGECTTNAVASVSRSLRIV